MLGPRRYHRARLGFRGDPGQLWRLRSWALVRLGCLGTRYVREQVGSPNHRTLHGREGRFKAPGPGVLEPDFFDLLQDVDARPAAFSSSHSKSP